MAHSGHTPATQRFPLVVIFHDWRTKALAVLLALLAWLYAYRGDVREEREVRAWVSRDSLPDTVAVVDCPVASVSLRVRGTLYNLNQMREGRDSLYVDLDVPIDGDVTEVTRRDVRITPSNVKGLPAGVIIEDISPEKIRVAFDRRVTEELSVQVRTEGTLKKGYTMVGEPRVYPKKVEVSGPKVVVENVTFIETEPVSLDDLDRDKWYAFRNLVPKVKHPKTGEMIAVQLKRNTVDVEVRVSPEYEEKRVTLKVLVMSETGYAYKLKLLEDTVDVRLKALKGVMTKDVLDRVAAFVDTRRFDPKAPVNAQVRLYLPDGVMLAQEGPLEVKVLEVIPTK